MQAKARSVAFIPQRKHIEEEIETLNLCATLLSLKKNSGRLLVICFFTIMYSCNDCFCSMTLKKAIIFKSGCCCALSELQCHLLCCSNINCLFGLLFDQIKTSQIVNERNETVTLGPSLRPCPVFFLSQ